MFSKSPDAKNTKRIDYPIFDGQLPFSGYIQRCRDIISENRVDLTQNSNPAHIIDVNSPYELMPEHARREGERLKYGALLIHGLFDCPFSLRDLGEQLQQNGVFCRSILLPGHGTKPSDLLDISYHDWIQAVRYGVWSIRQMVDKVILVGFSTGAALSIYQALHDMNIAGIILIAPAIRIKEPVDKVFSWHYLIKHISNNRKWILREEEIDYSKYLSIAFNPVVQVSRLTDVINELYRRHHIKCPIFMAISKEDETVSSQLAIDFFSKNHHPDSRMLLYTSRETNYSDKRIIPKQGKYPDLHIKHLSHVALPFSPQNFHYGQSGDYPRASRINGQHFIYGAYNKIQEDYFDLLYKFKMTSQLRRSLTYNPDFDEMASQMTEFVLRC